jgi:hypothetical protein
LDYHRWHRRRHVFLFVDGYVHELHPHKRICIMVQVTAGHEIDMAIGQLDTQGNPMITPVAFDSPPVWTNAPSAPGIDTLTPSSDGTTAILTTLPGDANSTDTVTLACLVGGVSYGATLAVAISVAPQVLGSVVINATVK